MSTATAILVLLLIACVTIVSVIHERNSRLQESETPGLPSRDTEHNSYPDGQDSSVSTKPHPSPHAAGPER